MALVLWSIFTVVAVAALTSLVARLVLDEPHGYLSAAAGVVVAVVTVSVVWVQAGHGPPVHRPPRFGRSVADAPQTRALVGFLQRNRDERIWLDVRVSGWAGGGLGLGQDRPAPGDGSVVGFIGDPRGCGRHATDRAGYHCAGVDLYVTGMRSSDSVNGFFWDGDETWRMRGSFLDLGAHGRQSRTGWRLAVVRGPT